MSARSFGRSASRSAEWLRVISCSRWKLSKVVTEFWRSEKISCVTCDWMLRRTRSRLNEVRAAVMSTMESRNLVRSRTLTIPALLQRSTDELIAYTVYRPEVYGIGRFLLQFLAKLQDMVVDG